MRQLEESWSMFGHKLHEMLIMPTDPNYDMITYRTLNFTQPLELLASLTKYIEDENT